MCGRGNRRDILKSGAGGSTKSTGEHQKRHSCTQSEPGCQKKRGQPAAMRQRGMLGVLRPLDTPHLAWPKEYVCLFVETSHKAWGLLLVAPLTLCHKGQSLASPSTAGGGVCPHRPLALMPPSQEMPGHRKPLSLLLEVWPILNPLPPPVFQKHGWENSSSPHFLKKIWTWSSSLH